MAFSTNYEDINDYSILPEGDYEVIIRNIEERATKNGKWGLNFSLVVRNDVAQEYKNRYIFYTIWKRKEPSEADKQVRGYSFKQIMQLAKSAKLPSGKSYDSLEDMCKDLMHKPIKITINHEDYNGKPQERVRYVNASDHPECRHVFKEKPIIDGEAIARKTDPGFASASLIDSDLKDFENVISDKDIPF